MISTEKPGTPQEILEHHGVLGMKWGHRSSKEFGQKFPTGHSRAAEIHRARLAQRKKEKGIRAEPNPSKKAKLEKVYLKNPDRATSLRLTRGEKATLAILGGVFGVTGVIPLAVGAAIGTMRVQRGRAEARQTRR